MYVGQENTKGHNHILFCCWFICLFLWGFLYAVCFNRRERPRSTPDEVFLFHVAADLAAAFVGGARRGGGGTAPVSGRTVPPPGLAKSCPAPVSPESHAPLFLHFVESLLS